MPQSPPHHQSLLGKAKPCVTEEDCKEEFQKQVRGREEGGTVGGREGQDGQVKWWIARIEVEREVIPSSPADEEPLTEYR